MLHEEAVDAAVSATVVTTFFQATAPNVANAESKTYKSYCFIHMPIHFD